MLMRIYVDCLLEREMIQMLMPLVRAPPRTGNVVPLSGCPFVWKSQLQSLITCFALEAVYTTLSYALRVLLPIKHILLCEALQTFLDIPQSSVPPNAPESLRITKQGAYYLAVNHRITNRTRYFPNKWHWFWEHVNEFEFHKVNSCNHCANYYFTTKLLPKNYLTTITPCPRMVTTTTVSFFVAWSRCKMPSELALMCNYTTTTCYLKQ